MLSKWLPFLVTAGSAGGALIYLWESEIKISSIVDKTTDDEDWLRERNPEAFKLGNAGTNIAGSVWKTNAIGTVHPDKTYFVFDDWSWLNGVKINTKTGTSFTKGERLKSYINGVGLKVEEITDKWEQKDKDLQNTRNIKVKRVIMKDGYSFERGTCFLKATDKKADSDTNLYLLIGFIKAAGDKKSKPNSIEFVKGHESFCSAYANGKYGQKIGGSEIAVSFDVTNGEITRNEYPVIAESRGLTPIYLNKANPVNAVVLGMAIKGKMEWKENYRAGEHLTKDKAIKEIQKKIGNSKNQIIGIFSGNKMTGFKINKESTGSNKLYGEPTESWISTAKVTYKT